MSRLLIILFSLPLLAGCSEPDTTTKAPTPTGTTSTKLDTSIRFEAIPLPDKSDYKSKNPKF